MTEKRALIVDDSRSAREVLSRMLETFELHVDTVESGEQALHYLRSSRPDVIFMDHLMPGMDGFETARTIKGTAYTADIPIVMYSSQADEAYLRDARKVGAIGVLSKLLKQTDVAHFLYELRLLPNRREERESTNNKLIDETLDEVPSHLSAVASRPTTIAHQISPSISSAKSEQQHKELQQVIKHQFDDLAHHLRTELHSIPRIQPAATNNIAQPTGRLFIVPLICLALLITAAIGFVYWHIQSKNRQTQQSIESLATIVAQQKSHIEALRTELIQRRELEKSSFEISRDGVAKKDSFAVPYGELPFANARIQPLQAKFDQLIVAGFIGKLRVINFIGDFCLSGSTFKGYSLARDELPARRCDLIGNPFEDSLNMSQRQSTEFSTLLNVLNPRTATNTTLKRANNLAIELESGGRIPAVAYPSPSDTLTAGEWNRAATQNNRVEFIAVAE